MSNIREYFNRQFQQLSFLNNSVREEFLKLDESVKQNVELFSKFPKPVRKFVKPSISETKKETIQSKPTSFVQSDKLFLNVQKRIGQLEKRYKNTNQIISGKITIGNLKGLNFKSLFPQTQKISQSSLDYSARDSINEVKLEQIKYMKDILELLNAKVPKTDEGTPTPQKKPPEESPLSWFKNVILGTALGALVPLVGGAFTKVGGIFSKAKGLLGKAPGKLLAWAGVATSAVHGFKTLKNAVSDFSKYSSQGHIAAAQSSLLYGTMGVTGDLFNAIGSIPSPASVPLLVLGTGLTTFAEKFRDTAKDEAAGYIGQAEAKSQQVAKLIQEKKEAGTFLEMRPNLSDPSDYFWEYRSGNKWLPVMDNGTGKKMSMMRGQDKIVPFSDGSGIQRYRIKTNTGIRDLEIDQSGKIVMRIPNIPNGVPVTSKESSTTARPVTPQAKPAVGAKSQSLTDPTIQKDLNAVDKDVSAFDRLFGKLSSIFETTELTKMSGSSFTGTSVGTIPSETVPTGTPGTVESNKAGDFTATRGNLTITRTEIQKQALANATFNNEMFLGQTNPKITSPFYKWRSADWYVSRFGKSKNHTKPHAHGGVDIGVPSGTKVRSLYSGKATVSKLGISVDTDRDIRLNYWHIQPSVKTGDSVVVGQELGTVYKDKYSTGPHLHFEVQSLEGLRQDKKVSPGAYVIDPAAWLADKDAPAHKFDLLPYTSQTAAFVKGTDGPRKIPAYAKGTSYVPEDMVARVHKDEIILTQQQAKKIKAEAKSRKPNISKMAELQEYNVFEDSDFWINTFMPALAEVVRMEYET